MKALNFESRSVEKYCKTRQKKICQNVWNFFAISQFFRQFDEIYCTPWGLQNFRSLNQGSANFLQITSIFQFDGKFENITKKLLVLLGISKVVVTLIVSCWQRWKSNHLPILNEAFSDDLRSCYR